MEFATALRECIESCEASLIAHRKYSFKLTDQKKIDSEMKIQKMIEKQLKEYKKQYALLAV